MIKNGRNKCFDKRDRNLKRVMIDYKLYLSSPLWKMIRQSVLQKRNHVCHFCKGRATEVHHTRYTCNVLFALNQHYLSGLVATCRNCHQHVSEFAKKEKIHEAHAFQINNIKQKAT